MVPSESAVKSTVLKNILFSIIFTEKFKFVYTNYYYYYYYYYYCTMFGVLDHF
jgi:hypothetical protein